MRYILKQTWKATGIFAEVAEFMNLVGAIINGTRVVSGGHMDLTSNGMLFYLTAATKFSGTAYAPNGTKTEDLNLTGSKAWVKWSTSDYAFTEETGPPGSPWGSDEVWFEKANTAGNIVVSRLG